MIHEFAHGVVASAHKVKVKNAGPAIFGPFFAAFVEPDEKQLAKKQDVVQYSMLAAGSFSNMLLALIVSAVLFLVLTPLIGSLYPTNGVLFEEIENPALQGDVEADVRYVAINNVDIVDASGFVTSLQTFSPGDMVVLTDADNQSRSVLLGQHPDDSSRAYLGVRGVSNSFTHQDSIGFTIFNWTFRLLSLIVGLSLGIGLAKSLTRRSIRWWENVLVSYAKALRR